MYICKKISKIYQYIELSLKSTYYAISCSILICLFKSSFAQTTQISGVINSYARVSAIDENIVRVVTDGANIFSTNMPDTVLIIQMTGLSQEGTIVNNAGRYELNIVTNVVEDGSDFIVTLKAPVASDYDVREIVQMIRVPSYKNATTTGTLTCKAWNLEEGTGGVLALIVEDLFTVNHNVDVSGRGFRGGMADINPYAGGCGNQLSVLENQPLAGNKGEGAIMLSYLNQVKKGWGPTSNGGGGGNGQWSGGGGGANGGLGGNGGNQACGAAGSYGGNYGLGVRYDLIDPSKHVFMGGGGGAGTRDAEGTGTAGGNGGGIVIIVANRLRFTSNAAIKANGEAVNGVAIKAGAGGGGAGGSILISANSFDDNNIKAEIMGGKGGNVDVEAQCGNSASSGGAGGGGSGGLLLTSRNRDTFKEWYENPDRFNMANGNFGEFVNKPLQTQLCVASEEFITSGENGIYLGDFKVHANGFLLNYIFTQDTYVCYDETITVSASEPVVDIRIVFSFQWQSSQTGLDDWKDIPNENEINLTMRFTHDLYVRRAVNTGTFVDYTLPVKISVYEPVINEIASMENTVLCGGQSLTVFEDVQITGGGNEGIHYYITWQKFDGVWENIIGALGINLTIEIPDETIARTYRFQRTVESANGCISRAQTSDIIVQPAIKNNAISPEDLELCEDTALPIVGFLPSGGEGTIAYQWQISTNGNDWKDIEGTAAKQQDYRPNLITHGGYGKGMYRRLAESGRCVDASNIVHVSFYQQPSSSQIYGPHRGEDDPLIFQFSMPLVAVQPSIGVGVWSSDSENLRFQNPKDASTTVSELQMGSNTVYWTVSNGVCVTIPAKLVIYVDDVVIPSGFSPTGDGKNDCFRVIGGENALTSELTVFDRYNNVVFESKDFNKGSSNLDDCNGWWDGRSTSGNQLPAGTYYYQLILNGNKIYKGYVILKR